MLALWHLKEGISKVCLPGFFFGEPDFMKALSADTTAQVSMELGDQITKVS